MRKGLTMGNNAGLVTTTAGPDLVHTWKTTPVGSGFIRKIMAYNNTGARQTLIFGTRTNAAIPGWVPLMPAIVLIDTFGVTITAEDIPQVEFVRNLAALAAGLEGNIWVQCTAVGVLLRIEVEEIGA